MDGVCVKKLTGQVETGFTVLNRLLLWTGCFYNGGGNVSISKEEVRHVAELARLSLTEEETETFSLQLSDILDFAGKLNELDTEEVEPTSHVLPIQNVLREDEVRPSWPREKVLSNAPDVEAGQFKVPAILEE